MFCRSDRALSAVQCSRHDQLIGLAGAGRWMMPFHLSKACSPRELMNRQLADICTHTHTHQKEKDSERRETRDITGSATVTASTITIAITSNAQQTSSRGAGGCSRAIYQSSLVVCRQTRKKPKTLDSQRHLQTISESTPDPEHKTTTKTTKRLLPSSRTPSRSPMSSHSTLKRFSA